MGWKPPRNRKGGQAFIEWIDRSFVKRRKEIGLTQDEVNHKLGCADRLIAKYECGSHSPGFFMTWCWARVLKCRVVLVPEEHMPAVIKILKEDPYGGEIKVPSE